MTTSLRLGLLALAFAALAPTARAQLIFSEYIEGSSNNKALEILNTTASPIDLAASGIVVQLYSNGATSPTNTATLTGTIASGDVYVIANASASATILAQADVTSSVTFYNGDDALVLRSGGAAGPVLDVIGQVGVDPGTMWGTGSTTTLDDTLIRKASACTGDTNPADAYDPATYFDGFPQDTFSDLGSYSGPCVAAGGNTTVQFASASATRGEAAGTYVITVNVANPSGSTATTFDVAFLTADPGTSGSASDIGGFATESVSVPAGASSATVTVTITNDTDVEPTETFVFEIQNVAGGTNAEVGAQDQFTLSITDNDTPVATDVVVNEVDSDTPSADAAEFIELYDGGDGNTALDGLVLVLINGSTNTVYATFDLDGFSTDGTGLFVAGNPGVNGVELEIPPGASGAIQNGPDAVAVYQGNPSDYPVGSAASTTAVVDVYVYGTDDPRDEDLLAALGETVQFDEGYEGAPDVQSGQRLNPAFGALAPTTASLGTVAPLFSGLFYALAPTPGATNPSDYTVDETEEVFGASGDVSDNEAAGYRLLSSPLAKADGSFFAVGDYAPINLIQGVPAGTTNPAQYPTAGDNMLTVYNGDGTFSGPATTDEALPPGEGFFWYWYDRDIIPTFPDGTSRSFDLANPDFQFGLSGVPIDDLITGGTYGAALPQTADGFYMVGNPYAYPYRLGGTTVSQGTLSSNFFAYDPEISNYVQLTADFGSPFSGDALAVWNGVFAEVTGVPAPVPTVGFFSSSAYVDPVVDSTFIGRTAGGSGEARLALALDAVTEAGNVPVDRAAIVRFRDDALVDWDLHDASKPIPPTPTALIAIMGVRDGEPRRQAVRSLPVDFGASFEMAVSFGSYVAGTYQIGAEDLAAFPDAWSVRLTDHLTGATTNLREGTYVFATEATEWADRFTLTVSNAVVAAPPGAPVFELTAVAPNPTSAQAALSLRVDREQHVRAEVYDALGRRVATLLDGDVAVGEARTLVLDASALAPGAYVVRVAGETFAETRRLTVVR
jgi:hypothetical protein